MRGAHCRKEAGDGEQADGTNCTQRADERALRRAQLLLLSGTGATDRVTGPVPPSRSTACRQQLASLGPDDEALGSDCWCASAMRGRYTQGRWTKGRWAQPWRSKDATRRRPPQPTRGHGTLHDLMLIRFLVAEAWDVNLASARTCDQE